MKFFDLQNIEIGTWEAIPGIRIRHDAIRSRQRSPFSGYQFSERKPRRLEITFKFQNHPSDADAVLVESLFDAGVFKFQPDSLDLVMLTGRPVQQPWLTDEMLTMTIIKYNGFDLNNGFLYSGITGDFTIAETRFIRAIVEK